ncbi:MAG: hypothetical protein ACK4NC_01475 [Candidatus Gracilibacteria bacterium]
MREFSFPFNRLSIAQKDVIIQIVKEIESLQKISHNPDEVDRLEMTSVQRLEDALLSIQNIKEEFMKEKDFIDLPLTNLFLENDKDQQKMVRTIQTYLFKLGMRTTRDLLQKSYNELVGMNGLSKQMADIIVEYLNKYNLKLQSF